MRYGRPMGRRTAIVGLVLAAVGLLLSLVLPSMWTPSPITPMNRALAFLLGFVPSFGILLLGAGAVMLALAVLVVASGRLPVVGRLPVLLWAGLAMWVVAVVAEFLLMSSSMSSHGLGSILPLFQALQVVQWTASTLVALWLTGLVTSSVPMGDDRAGTADEVRV